MTVRLLTGDCREVLKTLPDQSVNCCVTSPPYWGLRSYLPDDHPDKPLEIGSEPTVDEWVQTMVEVFREVRRVLRDDGTLWLNLGDSYAGSRCGGATGASTLQGSRKAQDQAKAAKRAMTASRRRDNHEVPRSDRAIPGLKPKDLVGQPWLVAFALRADGWWLRQELIWAKHNPMPESARDRFTKSHEHVFLLSKSERYYFDHDAVQEPSCAGREADARSKRTPYGWATGSGDHTAAAHQTRENHRKTNGVGFGHGFDAKTKPRAKRTDDEAATRNPRSVRWLATEPCKLAHFATYPQALIVPFITAGCPPGGTVLDPFSGSGTTGLVADRLGRNAILIDLDERNDAMARERIISPVPLLAQVESVTELPQG